MFSSQWYTLTDSLPSQTGITRNLLTSPRAAAPLVLQESPAGRFNRITPQNPHLTLTHTTFFLFVCFSSARAQLFAYFNCFSRRPISLPVTSIQTNKMIALILDALSLDESQFISLSMVLKPSEGQVICPNNFV